MAQTEEEKVAIKGIILISVCAVLFWLMFYVISS